MVGRGAARVMAGSPGSPGGADSPVPDPVAQPIGLLEGISTTRAIRRYTEEPVTDAQLATILHAATRAPTGSNRQPFRFLVLRDGQRAVEAKRLIGGAAQAMWREKRVHDGYDRGSGTHADSPKARMERTMQRYVDDFDRVPVLVLPCLVRYRKPSVFEGSSIYPACQNLLLAARAIGLGGVLTGFHHAVEGQLTELLGLPADAVIHATITLGHPEGRHGPVRRRPLAELVYEDSWGASPSWAVDPEGTAFTSAGPPKRAQERNERPA
jgi:nitroreductase